MVQGRTPNRGPGFNLHCGHNVGSLSKTHLFTRVLVNTQEALPNIPVMTEKLLIGKLKLNPNQTQDR